MQKKNVLLILTADEKKEARNFLKRRLKTLDAEQASQVQMLSQMARQITRRLQMSRSQYMRSNTRAGKLFTKLHDAALADLQSLIADMDQTTERLQQKAAPEQSAQGAKTEQDQKVDDLIVTCDEDELAHAADMINGKLEELRLPELKSFRDACQEILTWWDSERGQVDSLHMDKVGNINSAAGRLAIRQKRDEFQKTVLNPFKAFFQDLNMSYQRAAKEATSKARQRAAQRQNAQS